MAVEATARKQDMQMKRCAAANRTAGLGTRDWGLGEVNSIYRQRRERRNWGVVNDIH